MEELKCSNCGATITSETNNVSYICPYCGSKFLKDEAKENSLLSNILKYGYSLLADFEFEKAYSVFESGLNYDLKILRSDLECCLRKTTCPLKKSLLTWIKTLKKQVNI